MTSPDLILSKDKFIMVKVPPDLDEGLKQKAKQMGLDKSTLVRVLVEAWMNVYYAKNLSVADVGSTINKSNNIGEQ